MTAVMTRRTSVMMLKLKSSITLSSGIRPPDHWFELRSFSSGWIESSHPASMSAWVLVGLVIMMKAQMAIKFEDDQNR